MSGLGCVAFCVHVLGPVSSPLWVSDLSLRHAVGEGFLLGLRPDLGGLLLLFWCPGALLYAQCFIILGSMISLL